MYIPVPNVSNSVYQLEPLYFLEIELYQPTTVFPLEKQRLFQKVSFDLQNESSTIIGNEVPMSKT